MSRVYVLVEGQTEQAFVRDVLTPTLSIHGIYPQPVLLGKPGHKGGIRSFAVVQRDISNLLKHDANAFVTTLFDRYGLPSDWPGLAESKLKGELPEAHSSLCQAMHSEVSEKMGPDFRARRFLPYIQFYETEAYLFAAPDETARVLGNDARAEDLRGVVREKGGCEDINDDATTAPSKRIIALFPVYKKGKGINAHLPRICSEVGLQTLRDACPLFNRWVQQLETLALD
jgi:Domain of unknown function (DUF4276)